MASELSNSSSSLITKLQEEQSTRAYEALPDQIEQLIDQIRRDRVLSVREKLKQNRNDLETHVSVLFSVAKSRNGVSVTELNEQGKMLSSRVHNPLCNFSGFPVGSMEKEYLYIQEVVHPTSVKLPCVEKIPPYTTWVFLDRFMCDFQICTVNTKMVEALKADQMPCIENSCLMSSTQCRNQRMADDQSVAGKRRIYYDPHGSEALICSDSEEEIPEPEEDKHEFSEGEDRILWMAFQEYGLCEEVLNIVSQYIGGTSSEIRERCNLLAEKNKVKHELDFTGSRENASQKNNLLEKSLSAALDSFDNLFCRRCLVFDCRLHGCSQSIINPSSKHPYSSESDNDRNPCSDQCYLRSKCAGDLVEGPAVNAPRRSMIKSSDDDGETPATEGTVEDHEKGKRKIQMHTSGEPQDFSSEDVQSRSKRPKVPSADDNVVSFICEENATVIPSSSGETEVNFREPDKHETLEPPKDAELLLTESGSNKFNFDSCVPDDGKEDSATPKSKVINHIADPTSSSSSKGLVKGVIRNSDWKPFEKELYLKGVEIFGRDSCLIARNLLAGLKTCIDVANFMYDDGIAMPRRAFDMSSSEENKNDLAFLDREVPTRSRLCRRRGKTRKLKYSWKSAGHPSFWKRIADGKHRSCKQYTPCGCQPTCGKQCPCLDNGTCCEKYCGCSKSCKNRFRGCHCAKSQCRSRQCPCFAAGRECDPDVCRNCWVSCGDGSFGEPPRKGDGQCGNMRLLLRQQQRILLAKSEVAGWGAFLKNPVNKNDYLGEYTGELISHREADKRGKIYDRANSSFLFDLNEQYVLDAYRKGDKLKFANHSADPNCYAKVMLVAGDHRVGIFAKERIEASEEIFYDYRYGPNEAPAWARRPEGSKGDDPPNSQGRAKKHQSH